MVFERPREDSSPLEPDRYILKLVRLEELPPSEQHPDWGPSIKWVFHCARFASGEVIYTDDGQLYEFFQMTSPKLTPKSRARPWVETFLGRALTADDEPEAIATALVGTKAVAMIGPDNDAGGRTRILAIYPYKEPAKGAGKGAGKSAAVAVLEDDLPAAAPAGDESAFAF